MAGPGGGPSRRSHTKSRKGCKTCKKRHIRCDEAYPQCRNCTKHQVRCDYQDTTANEEESKSPPQINLMMTPEIEKAVHLWQQSGRHPFPDLVIRPQPQWHAYSTTELRLIHHALFLCNEMHLSHSSKLTMWTAKLPRFVSSASHHPFLMHAILSISAANLAWLSQSAATRSLAFHHRGVALRGLHEAIGEFSQENSDAVLTASVILSWQAIDWRGWASLMTGIRIVINAMQPWKTESHYQDLIAEQGTIKFQSMAHPSQPQSNPTSRRGSLTILQHIYTSLQKLHPYLAGRESEMRWVEQLKAYLQKIRISTPAQSPEEQFIQLYILRKWLFWVPVSLISQQGRDFSVLVVMAYLYATALAIEPLFPDVGAPFCAEMSARPLEEILTTLNMLNTARGHVQNAYTAAAALLEFPREALTDYRARSAFEQQQAERTGLVRRTSYGLENVNHEIENYFAEYRHRDGMSPGFPPSPLHFPPGAMVSGQISPFLELPRTNSMGDSYSSGSSYGSPLATPSLPRENSSQGEQYQAAFNGFSFAGGPHSDGWHGGQVQRQDQSPYDEYFGKGKGKGRQEDSGV